MSRAFSLLIDRGKYGQIYHITDETIYKIKDVVTNLHNIEKISKKYFNYKVD